MMFKPICCITSDVDWASEECIADFITLCNEYDVKPLVLMTHKSEAVERSLAAGLIETGIHPNFLDGSTHGDGFDDVLKHCLSLSPSISVSRSHQYFDCYSLSQSMIQHGIRHDLNLCLHLQENITPLKHCSGILRFPTFWEDDVHAVTENGNWDFADYQRVFSSPGLKVINVHPIHIALNSPDMGYYLKHKEEASKASAEELKKIRFTGAGVRTFFIEILKSISDQTGQLLSFGDLLTLYSPKSVQKMKPAETLLWHRKLMKNTRT